MPDWTSPNDLAAELGVSGSSVRRWLRENVDRFELGPWRIDDETTSRIRAHFERTRPIRERIAGACSVNGCDEVAVGRGWCRMHYNRWHRTGIVDGIGRGGHQAAKTHCPHGHEYTPENTIEFPSDGQRRCRICRRGKVDPMG